MVKRRWQQIQHCVATMPPDLVPFAELCRGGFFVFCASDG